MRKLIVLVEAFALTAVTVTAITMNSQTAQMFAPALAGLSKAVGDRSARRPCCWRPR
jgi:hypothetical protein